MKIQFRIMISLMIILFSASVGAQVIINELDPNQASNDSQEFIELYDGGTGVTDLTGLIVVLYNGATDTSYRTIDLAGYSTDTTGYFVIGSTGMGTDIEIDPQTLGWLQNEADAVAVYADDPVNFPNGTYVTATNIVDAVVYGNDSANDTGLLNVLLNPGEPQVNENFYGSSDDDSIGRCPNGAGGAMNTVNYSWDPPSVGADNLCVDPTPTPIPTVTPTFPPAVDCDDENIVNGGFESWSAGAAGPPDNWTLEAPSSITFTAEQDSSFVHSGSYSTLFTKTSYGENDPGRIIHVIGTQILPNEVYELRVQVYDNSFGGTVRAQVRFKDASGTLVQWTDFTDYSVDSTSWQELSQVIISDPTAALAEVRIWVYDVDNGTASIYVDDISLVQPCSPAPTPSPTPTTPPTPTPTIAACGNNIIANPGFEDWTSGDPDHWLLDLGITATQNSMGQHGDLHCAELSNTLSGTDLTSEYMPVNGGSIYEAGIWLIDNDLNVNAQFYVLFYNVHFNWIGSTTWHFTSGENPDWQEIDAGSFSVPVTAEWARVRVRFVNNDGDPPDDIGVLTVDDAWLIEPCAQVTPTPTTTPTGSITPIDIYSIQYNNTPPGSSPEEGNIVSTTGYVTAVEEGNPYFFIQSYSGPWNGLMIYRPTGPGSLARGDYIQVQGLIEEIDGMTVLTNPTSTIILSSGHPLPSFSTMTPGLMNSEAYESVLVKLQSSYVTNINTVENEWTVFDGSGAAVVDDLFSYSYVPTLGETIDWVQGPVTETSGTYKLQPRDDNDISATFVAIPATDWAGILILITVVGLLILRKR